MTNSTIDRQATQDGKMESGISYYSYTRPEILQLVPTTAVKILDVGCGTGVLGTSVKSRQNAEVHGVELMSQAAIKADACLDKTWNCTIESALPELADGYYDCIVAADVLEHVSDPWKVLIGLKEKLAPDGKIIVSLPNVQNWDIVSDLLAGKWDYRGEGILDRTHLHFFTRKSVEELFWNAGLRLAHLATTTRGTSLPNNIAQSLRNNGVSVDSLEADARTWQFLVVAERPVDTQTPRVAVIILNWNGKADTLECLESVSKLDYENHEVVVVDNGSTDDSVNVVRNMYPAITILQTGKNLGYAGGNNVGIHWALERGSDYVLVLNNDTIVDKFLINRLVSAGQLDYRIGLVGPVNYYYDKPTTVWTTGAMLGNPSDAGYRTLGDGDPAVFWETGTQVDAIVGSAMLIKRQVFDEIGFFDEQFFLCHEELDFCTRAQAAGYKCYFMPEAKIWHKVGGSLGEQESPVRTYFNVRNKMLWAKKNLPRKLIFNLHVENLNTLKRIVFPGLQLSSFNVFHAKKALWSLFSCFRAARRNLANPVNLATLIALRDYYFGRFGNCPPKVVILGRLAKET